MSCWCGSGGFNPPLRLQAAVYCDAPFGYSIAAYAPGIDVMCGEICSAKIPSQMTRNSGKVTSLSV